MDLRFGMLVCMATACGDATSADGSVPDLAGCPESASMGDPCSMPSLSCIYGSTICECDHATVFRCRSMACPAVPTPGILGNCDKPRLYCDYPGEAGCLCADP